MSGFKVAKGVKDWYGAEAILRNNIREDLRDIFEKYGYNPIETPMIETREALGFKGGGEIQKEVFRLSDQGGRNLALRFDHTVPLARFFATHNIPLPFKRYAIGEVFRDGPTQVEQGRYRIFTQCDVDALGIKDMTAEIEIFALARDAFEKLGLGEVDVQINNRKLLDGIMSYSGIPLTSRNKTLVALDKMDKIGISGVREELSKISRSLTDETLKSIMDTYTSNEMTPHVRSKILSEVDTDGLRFVEKTLKDSSSLTDLTKNIEQYLVSSRAFDNTSADKLCSLIKVLENNDKTYDSIAKILPENEGLAEIKQLLDYSKNLGFDFIKFDPSLARGLDYYTGTTIEVYLKNKDLMKSAIVAGGRFDDMVGDFKNSGIEIPAVGISFGLERLMTVLGKESSKKNTTDIYIIPIGDTVDYCLQVSQDLRKQGLNVDMHHGKYKKVGDVLSHVDSIGVPYAALVGEDEVNFKTISLKEMNTGKRYSVGLESIYDEIKR